MECVNGVSNVFIKTERKAVLPVTSLGACECAGPCTYARESFAAKCECDSRSKVEILCVIREILHTADRAREAWQDERVKAFEILTRFMCTIHCM